MKFLIFLFSGLVLISCNNKDDSQNDSSNETISFLVAPSQTDANYATNQEKHYVLTNTTLHTNELILFIGGSFSVPENYNIVCNNMASLGFDLISISYPNDVPAANLSNNQNPLAFDFYRDEICFGNPMSDVVDVNELNSINVRTIKLLQFLKKERPNENWGQYLSAQNTLNWSNIIVAGHSQGSGHACYFGKKKHVNRVLMFSGPNDFSDFFNAPANWLSQEGLTPLSKQFALLHERDQIVLYENQKANLVALGLLNNGEEPTHIDNLNTPYENANALSTNIFGLSFHNATIGNNSKLPSVWKYMLTGN
ncbi:MAG: BPSS1187 family protein [Flavobacteriales bacterium]